MATPFLIVDGYNLLHAAGLARLRYAPGDLERARHRLLALLCEKLTAAEQLRCTVVFDAQAAPLDVARESRHQQARVLFAAPGSDADTLIEELIATHPAARQLIVVSGDHRLHKAARRRGAHPLDSEVFWERLQQRPDARTALSAEPPAADSQRAAQPPPRTSTETERWLREFGEISVDEIAAEVRAEEQAATTDPWQQHLRELERQLADDSEREDWLAQPSRRPPRRK